MENTLVSTEKSMFIIKNELGHTIGTFLAISQEKLEIYINENNLFPKTDIAIELFDLEENLQDDVVPIISSERFLWYELKHHNVIHVVNS